MRDAVRITIGVILLLVIEYLGAIYGVWPKPSPTASHAYFDWWLCGGRQNMSR